MAPLEKAQLSVNYACMEKSKMGMVQTTTFHIFSKFNSQMQMVKIERPEIEEGSVPYHNFIHIVYI